MKNKIFPLIASLAILVTATSQVSHAQQWSEEEQELLDALEADWDAWMEGVAKKDPNVWLKKTNVDEKMTYWWSENGAPLNLRTLKRDWESISEVDLGWVDYRPVSIRIHDNVGIIHFYGYWKAKSDKGPVTTEYKRTEFWLKKKGKWTFMAGHGSPVSAKDADPYK